MNEVAKNQNFKIERVNRSDITGAEYNPRKISKENEKRLKKALKENGLVVPILVNKRTGNVVSGHQRLKAIDALERTKNYALDVAVIDVDEQQEAKLNVQMNNQSMMGDYDIDALSELMADFDLQIDELGFSEMDAQMLVDDFEDDSTDAETREIDELTTEQVEEEKNRIAEIKSQKKKMREENKNRNDVDYYATLIFPNAESKRQFMHKLNIPEYEKNIFYDNVEKLFKD